MPLVGFLDAVSHGVKPLPGSRGATEADMDPVADPFEDSSRHAFLGPAPVQPKTDSAFVIEGCSEDSEPVGGDEVAGAAIFFFSASQ